MNLSKNCNCLRVAHHPLLTHASIWRFLLHCPIFFSGRNQFLPWVEDQTLCLTSKMLQHFFSRRHGFLPANIHRQSWQAGLAWMFWENCQTWRCQLSCLLTPAVVITFKSCVVWGDCLCLKSIVLRMQVLKCFNILSDDLVDKLNLFSEHCRCCLLCRLPHAHNWQFTKLWLVWHHQSTDKETDWEKWSPPVSFKFIKIVLNLSLLFWLICIFFHRSRFHFFVLFSLSMSVHLCNKQDSQETTGFCNAHSRWKKSNKLMQSLHAKI